MRAQGRRGFGIATSLLSAALALSLPGCGALAGLFREMGIGVEDAQWSERRYKNISSSSVLQLASTVVSDRYPPSELDLYRGRMETGWIYGRYSEITHQALRARVVVETESEDDAILLVRLRVQQETSESAGRTYERDVDDWEPADDDVQEANRLITKLNILLKEVAEPVVEPPAGS